MRVLRLEFLYLYYQSFFLFREKWDCFETIENNKRKRDQFDRKAIKKMSIVADIKSLNQSGFFFLYRRKKNPRKRKKNIVSKYTESSNTIVLQNVKSLSTRVIFLPKQQSLVLEMFLHLFAPSLTMIRTIVVSLVL